MLARLLCWLGFHKPRPKRYKATGKLYLVCCRKGCNYFYGDYDELS